VGLSTGPPTDCFFVQAFSSFPYSTCSLQHLGVSQILIVILNRIPLIISDTEHLFHVSVGHLYALGKDVYSGPLTIF